MNTGISCGGGNGEFSINHAERYADAIRRIIQGEQPAAVNETTCL